MDEFVATMNDNRRPIPLDSADELLAPSGDLSPN